MDDATGRFSQGFYWGNSYFTGSETECEYIGQGVSDLGATKLNHPEDTITIPQFNVQLEQPEKKRVQQPAATEAKFLDDRPPYPLGFYVLRISVNGSILLTVRFWEKPRRFSKNPGLFKLKLDF